jgi:ketosteroid isomerase-like protein
MRSLLCICLLFITGWHTSCLAQKKQDKQQVSKILHQQTEAWNRGDLREFMSGYWQSDSLKFIGKSGITYGWQNTLDNYLKSYPDRAAMGKLNFDILHMELQAEDVYTVIGKWHLFRQPAKEDLQGYFSLVWKKIQGRWVIVIDHSS